MRFLLGLLLGFGVGLAAAILFAPDKNGKTRRWPEGHPARLTAVSRNGDRNAGGVQGVVRSVQERLNEAWDEARKASSEAEREMTARYEELKRRNAAETAAKAKK